MLGLILAALAGFAIGAVIVVVILKWDYIINWLRSRQQLKESDKANVAFTLKERIETGDYVVIEGIFNKRTNEILDAEKVQAKNLDEKLAKVHQNSDLAIYE